ncbi:urease accessory protein UreF [Bradyrhizobium sp. LHD-71]|uniref:urease accessory protein UreF n=1 Tax=Bradyrhizobium sp. LHD-71 TaxID=3072141 RepID=UPI0028103F92|nr:urease accessory protein UreF [Bradyrhizobium sp. LHD-71]MDQ8726982.1 urease accessory protein UreF [Bradyrhizobium sp. LHD-71]
MRSVTGLLYVLQFADSALPVGAFSFSNGLESAIQQGVVRDPASLKQMVLAATEQAATLDGGALLVAHRAVLAADMQGLVAVDRAVYLRKLNEEMRTMTVRMGRKLGELGAHVLDTPLLADWVRAIKSGASPGTFPVGLALVTGALGVEARDAFAAHQYGVASMMLNAALRLMRVSYFDTQAILLEVNATAEDLYQRVRADTIDDIRAFAPLLDILAATHVRAHVRMFMN